jgi:NADH-quinone oxidoreductase subunit M
MFEMGGLVKKAPVLAAFFATAIFASIAVPGPGLANFWAEFTIFIAVWQWKAWILFPAVLGIIISAIYGLRALGRIFFGKPAQAFEKKLEAPVEDLRWNERLPAIVLIVALVAIGFWPRSITDQANAALKAAFEKPAASANGLAMTEKR